MVVSAFLAVDWGTTNRRIYRIEDGRVTQTERDGRGVTSMAAAEYPIEIARMRGKYGDLPILLAGMVGSTIGWQPVPYVPAPASLETIAAALLRLADRVAIVPGVSVIRNGRGDVMRGEETQLLGAVIAGLAPPDALLCQPGTHCKWATMATSEIVDFSTSMTGEFFALLGKTSILAPLLSGAVASGPAFSEGVTEGSRRDLAHSLFAIRAAHLLGLRADADAASYASGVLIGSDVAARLEEHHAQTVHILADAALGALYAAAIEQIGGHANVLDSHDAFVAGITRLMELA